MHPRLKRSLLLVADLVLAVYLVLAMVSFNHPKDTYPVCTKVSINIEDETTNGFLSADEIRKILERNRLYPFKKKMADVNPRDIEDLLVNSPFVNTAECYKTKDGTVCISLTQRLPIVRIKSIKGDDYYLDDHGGIMPNSKYTSDLIIATGYISRKYARNYLSFLAIELMKDDFWRNQIVQVNVLPNLGVELVPRVGEHIIYIGALPQTNKPGERHQLIADYITVKLNRLQKFYKYGLSQAGWNKYSYIDVEFDNQIICKKKKTTDLQKNKEKTI